MHTARQPLVYCVLCVCLSACALPASRILTPGLNPTDFLATRVPQVLTENAATLTAAPTPLNGAQAALTPALDPVPTNVPTPLGEAQTAATPTPALTPTSTPTPYPTLALEIFPVPPATFGGDPHFYFGRPIGEGGNVFIASSYRYGSTYNHVLETHHGVEFANLMGAPIVAVAPGTILYAGNDVEQVFGPDPNFYGNLVVLQLAQPWLGHTVYALYGHMDQVFVQSGQTVNTSDLLGTVGASGIARGPHLHLEVRLDQPESYWESRNPELWLAPITNAATIAVRVTDEDDRYLPGVRVGIICSDGAYRFLDTYWDPGVNPDDVYGENAAITDVPAGFCHFEATIGVNKLEATATIQAGAVTFVWLKP